MSAKNFTPEQLKVREITLERVVTLEHEQGDWIVHEGLSKYLPDEEESKPGQTVDDLDNLCGTAGCAAGHAVLSKTTGTRAHYGEYYAGRYGWLVQYQVDGKWFRESELLDYLDEGASGDWIHTGRQLLGLKEKEANLLFAGNNSHEQVVYTLQRLVKGKKITRKVQIRDWDDNIVTTTRLIPPPEGFVLPSNDVNRKPWS